MRLRLLLSAVAVLALSACATAARLDAAGDVHALLVSIRDVDRASFDAHVDKPALQAQLEARLLDESERRGKGDDRIRALGAVLARPLANLAGEALLRPDVFRSVAEYYGYRPGQPIPNQVVIAGSLKALPDGRVCATKKKDGPCFLTFTNEGGTWKLTGFEGDMKDLRR